MNPIDKLLEFSELEYVYHMNILNTLDFCVKNNVNCKSIYGIDHEGLGFHVFLTKADWPLAFSLCKCYFEQHPDGEDKLSVISNLRDYYNETY